MAVAFGVSLVAGAIGLPAGIPAPAAGAADTVPAVRTVAPTAVPVSAAAVVVVTGAGFTGATGLRIGDVDIDDTRWSVVDDRRIVVRLPGASTAGRAAITVTTPVGPSAANVALTYVGPSITAVRPAWATSTTAVWVTITGAGLGGGTAPVVRIGGVPSPQVLVVDDRTLVARTPVDDTGTPTAEVTNGTSHVEVVRDALTATLPDSFVFTPGPPTVTALSASDSGPDGAAIGTTLTVTGTNLFGVSSVFFATNQAIDVAPVGTDGTSLTVTIPKRSLSGPAQVRVVTPAGANTASAGSTFVFQPRTRPVLSTVIPTVLPASGGVLTVRGLNLTGTVAADIALVTTAGTVAAASVTVMSDRELRATFGAIGLTGSVDLSVTNGGGYLAVRRRAVLVTA